MTKSGTWLVAGFLMGAVFSTHAVGISCVVAQTRIDHMICDSKALVKADERLDRTYQQTLMAAADQAALIRSQRAWLKQRNACADSVCVTHAYVDRLTVFKQVKRAEWATFRDPTLGISFNYLANRHVEQLCPTRENERCVALVGKGVGISDYFACSSW
ncbi:lysozyme inhibitor LprI family protein [Paraburkholderia agricolaris]|uniref:Lysozyme inhibitor LprI family protein n=1 Tax=Paraburkholderia agricolaris TaxID=2152888 RepID=A0ABW8ZJ75_9BURK